MRRRHGRLHRGFLAHDFTHADNLTACDVRGLAGETDEGYCRCTARPLPTRAVTGRGATSWWPYIARTTTQLQSILPPTAPPTCSTSSPTAPAQEALRPTRSIC